MASKINAIGFRVGINKDWNSRWYSLESKKTGEWIVADEKIRKFFDGGKDQDIVNAKVQRVEIERIKTGKDITVNVYCANPGIINSSESKKKLILEINKIVGRKINVLLNIVTYENEFWSAKIIAKEIAERIRKGESFRTVQKNVIAKVIANGIIGIKTLLSGRLNGVDMARTEGYTKGVVSLTTIRSDIDYASIQSHTKMGVIGVKVWLYKGQILKKGLHNQIPIKSSQQVESEKEKRYSSRGTYNNRKGKK